jgi:hypothetical protein
MVPILTKIVPLLTTIVPLLPKIVRTPDQNSSSPNQNIPPIFLEHKRSRIHNSPPFFLNRSQISPIYALPIVYVIYILILSPHPCLNLPRALFPSGFPTKILRARFISSICATCPAYFLHPQIDEQGLTNVIIVGHPETSSYSIYNTQTECDFKTTIISTSNSLIKGTNEQQTHACTHECHGEH